MTLLLQASCYHEIHHLEDQSNYCPLSGHSGLTLQHTLSISYCSSPPLPCMEPVSPSATAMTSSLVSKLCPPPSMYTCALLFPPLLQCPFISQCTLRSLRQRPCLVFSCILYTVWRSIRHTAGVEPKPVGRWVCLTNRLLIFTQRTFGLIGQRKFQPEIIKYDIWKGNAWEMIRTYISFLKFQDLSTYILLKQPILSYIWEYSSTDF